MNKDDFLFVYGTLRRGQYADLQKQAHHFNIRYCGEDRINGKLYHIGAYPGLKLVGGTDFNPKLPVVTGEVFLVGDPAIGAFLDAYEGYDADNPSQGLYDRRVLSTEKDRMVWVYLYNPHVTSDQLIESGDWCKNPDMPMRQRRLRA